MKLATVLFIVTSATVDLQGSNRRKHPGAICNNFGTHFERIPEMRASCKTNRGRRIKKYYCHVKCYNGNLNVWSVRYIKCKVRNKGTPNEIASWNPNEIKGTADSLCGEKDECGSPESQYNISNKFLSWSKSQLTVRRTMYNFTCAPYIRRNGEVVPLVPFPTDFATCTCNYNKPTNIRCKWSKIKSSIVRCVKETWYSKLNDSDFSDEYFDEMFRYE